MGKPSIFSRKDTTKSDRLKQLVERERVEGSEDLRLTVLGEISNRLKHHMSITIWSAFGMYIFTIFAVRFLLQRIQAL